MTPQFQRDLDLASSLGHGNFQVDIRMVESIQREKFWFSCECGYRSTVRWSAAEAMDVAHWHIQKVARDHRSKNSVNGVSVPRNARAAG